MWKQTIDLFRQILLLIESSKRNQEKMTELQKEVTELSRSSDENFRRHQGMIERLAYEVKRLELENKALKEKRHLPPANHKNDGEDE